MKLSLRVAQWCVFCDKKKLIDLWSWCDDSMIIVVSYDGDNYDSTIMEASFDSNDYDITMMWLRWDGDNYDDTTTVVS